MLENDCSTENRVCVSQSERLIDDANGCVSPKIESIGDTAHFSLSDSDNEDLPDVHTLYTKTLKKSARIENLVKDLSKKLESLNQIVKQNAEEYTSQSLTHDEEIKAFEQKLKDLTESNNVLEKKYKGSLLEL